MQQHGLVLIGGDKGDDSEENVRSTFAIVTPEAARLLESAGDGPLGWYKSSLCASGGGSVLYYLVVHVDFNFVFTAFHS